MSIYIAHHCRKTSNALAFLSCRSCCCYSGLVRTQWDTSSDVSPWPWSWRPNFKSLTLVPSPC